MHKPCIGTNTRRVVRSKVLVSRQYYKAIGKGGTFTRLKGLDNNTNKELLKRHMKDMGNSGLKLRDFQQVLPSLDIRNIQWLLIGGVLACGGCGSEDGGQVEEIKRWVGSRRIVCAAGR